MPFQDLFYWLPFCTTGLWAAMTKSYEFNWQKHVPSFLQEGAIFDRFDEVNLRSFAHQTLPVHKAEGSSTHLHIHIQIMALAQHF